MKPYQSNDPWRNFLVRALSVTIINYGILGKLFPTERLVSKGSSAAKGIASRALMRASICAQIIILALIAPVNAQQVIELYSQDFENPVGFVSVLGLDASAQSVNSLYSGQPPGFTFQQVFTVETLNITGGTTFPNSPGGPGYVDPSGQGGNYALGMLSSTQNDLLGLAFDTGGLGFINFKVDLSAIGIQTHGSSTVPPVYRFSLFDNPGGLPSGATSAVSGNGVLLNQFDVTASASPRNTFAWTTAVIAFDTSQSVDGNVTLRVDLLSGGYAALDNWVITSSTTPGGGLGLIKKTLTNPLEDEEVTAVGQVIEYTIKVSSLTNLSLTNPVVEDTFPDGSTATLTAVSGDTNNNGEVDPNETWEYSASYTVTQADVIAGGLLTNTAKLTADEIADETDTAVSTITIPLTPDLTVSKDFDDAADATLSATKTVDYTITVVNTGDVGLTNVVITDAVSQSGDPDFALTPALSAGDTNSNSILDIDETWTYTASYDVTPADIENGADLTNTFTVNTAETTDPVSDTAVSAITQAPAIEIIKTGVATIAGGQDPNLIDQGDTITYSLVVTNNGNVTLTSVGISSDILSLGIDASGASTDLTSTVSFVSNSGSSPAGTLAPGETATFTADYLIGEDASDAGGVSNSATASGISPSGGTLVANTVVPAVTAISPSVDIDVIEDVLSDDLLRTVTILSNNASQISRDAADRLRINRNRACGAEINDLLRATPVRFANDSFVIGVQNNALLDEVVRVLNTCPTAEFTITGHTDSDASDAYNLVLSQNRVDAVKEALLQRGIENDRIQTRGLGERSPVASNATKEGKALNRRVEFILTDDVMEADLRCGSANQHQRSLNGSGNDQGMALSGSYASQGYNCLSGVYSETWSELNVTHDDDRGTLGLWTFGTLRERQADNRLFGRFIEGYVSKYDVTSTEATGTITGVGVHGGLYGAYGTEGGLILSYYGSAAVGRHSFELNAGADANGSYTYYGLFAGGALGGQHQLGDYEVRPRVGVDLAYGEAMGSEISVRDVELEIDPATYTRGFAEFSIARDLEQGTMTFTPRIFCVQNSQDADACGSGASLGYKTFAEEEGVQWDMSVNYEKIADRQTGSIRIARSQEVFDGLGVSRSSLGSTAGGGLELSQTLDFKW